MEKRIVSTKEAPSAIGPYSQAVWSGDWLFCSGQVPLDPVTGEIVGKNVAEQTERCFENLRGLLASQGLDFANVVKVTVFLTDMGHFSDLNAVYARYFDSQPPARSCVAVVGLPKGVLVEIDVIACR